MLPRKRDKKRTALPFGESLSFEKDITSTLAVAHAQRQHS
jgi:hypothetical protein